MVPEEVLIIMTWVEIIIKVGCLLLGIAVACLITGPKLAKAVKARKAAKTEEEKVKANEEIKSAIFDFVGLAEEKFATLNTALKNVGESGAGEYKKDWVLSSVRDLCDEKGYEYNKTEASEYVDKVVSLTKTVNK